MKIFITILVILFKYTYVFIDITTLLKIKNVYMKHLYASEYIILMMPYNFIFYIQY